MSFVPPQDQPKRKPLLTPQTRAEMRRMQEMAAPLEPPAPASQPVFAYSELPAPVEVQPVAPPATMDALTRSQDEQALQLSRTKLPLLGARKPAEVLQSAYLRLHERHQASIARMEQVGQQSKFLERQNSELRAALSRYEEIGVARLREESARLAGELERTKREVELAKEQLRIENQQLDVRRVSDLQDVSLYDFEHPAENSTKLADQLKVVRDSIKAMIRNKEAYTAAATFVFNKSEAKGRKFTSDMAKIMLAAYNSEAENAIKSIKAGGYQTGKARLDRVVERIARNGSLVSLTISPAYHRLRLQELRLAERHQQAVKREREKERERKAQLREQQKAEAELRREKERLEKERSHYENVLKTLRERGDEDEALKIETQLADVDRAINDVDYRAANIRAGYVYVISNIGTMGEKMVKIGMTRRLVPMDRVRELGDASVPFPFDVHALFFADDAVKIEAMLHREFADRRVNKINTRREFFYCTPDEVLEKLKSHGVSVMEYTLEPEAEQFRLSRGGA